MILRHWLILSVSAWLLPCGLAAETLRENARLSASGYVEIWPGTLPVVLSAPHGGTEKPPEVPDRAYGKGTLDANTRPLAYAIREAFSRRFGAAPPLVVCLMARRKVDCNREIREAAQGNAIAERVWHEFQDAITAAEAEVLQKHAHGIYFDIHGHGHPSARVELGYGLNAEELSWPDIKLNAPEVAAHSTVRLLDAASPSTFAELVRGPQSFGAMLEQRGIRAVPSPVNALKAGELFFGGGYNVQTHGSGDGKGLDAIQIEAPEILRRTPEAREALARAIVDATAEYVEKHRGVKLQP